MVSLLFAETQDAQVAVDQTADFVHANILIFKTTAQSLLLKAEEKNLPKHQKAALQDAITGYQFFTTGNIIWR